MTEAEAAVIEAAREWRAAEDECAKPEATEDADRTAYCRYYRACNALTAALARLDDTHADDGWL